MNLIVEKSSRIKWYIDLKPFFVQVPSIITMYEWMWTDIDVNIELPEHSIDQHERIWIAGNMLMQFVRESPQFSWSVLSAIDPIDLENAKSNVTRPFADGNQNLWLGSPKPQHPDARFEVVCWDSSATLLINANDSLTTAFRTAYPDCTDLDERNTKNVDAG